MDPVVQRFPHRREPGRQVRQRAQVGVAFFRAVEVGAARGEEVELQRHVGVLDELGRGVAAGHDFHRFAAVRSGRLHYTRVDSSVARILRAKARLGLHRERAVPIDSVTHIVGAPEHETVGEMSRCLAVIDESPGILGGEFRRFHADISAEGFHLNLAQQPPDDALALIGDSGNGSHIQNNNSTDPYGLYVNGTISNSGDGGTTTPNLGDQSTMQSTNLDFYNWVASQTNSPLPVTLLFFKVEEVSQSGVNLIWATASELNFDYFSLERSEDGFSFTELAKIKGSGNSKDRLDYSFEDTHPLHGTAYYRLKSIDYDGQTEIFRMISADFEGEENISIYPNPAVNGTVTIASNFTRAAEATLRIYDLNGAELERFAGLSGRFIQKIDLRSGIYLLKISTLNSEKTFKLAVR